MKLSPALVLAGVLGAAAQNSAFPGPWEAFIQAPDSSRLVSANAGLFHSEGSVSLTASNVTVLSGAGALATFEFPQNVGGRYVCMPSPATPIRPPCVIR